METEDTVKQEEAPPGADISQRIPAELLDSLPPPPTQDKPEPVRMGTEDWHTAVPPVSLCVHWFKNVLEQNFIEQDKKYRLPVLFLSCTKL